MTLDTLKKNYDAAALALLVEKALLAALALAPRGQGAPRSLGTRSLWTRRYSSSHRQQHGLYHRYPAAKGTAARRYDATRTFCGSGRDAVEPLSVSDRVAMCLCPSRNAVGPVRFTMRPGLCRSRDAVGPLSASVFPVPPAKACSQGRTGPAQGPSLLRPQHAALVSLWWPSLAP